MQNVENLVMDGNCCELSRECKRSDSFATDRSMMVDLLGHRKEQSGQGELHGFLKKNIDKTFKNRNGTDLI